MSRIAIYGLLCVSIGVVAAIGVGCVADRTMSAVGLAAPNAVGRVGANRYETPTGQVLTPAGRQVELPGMRPQALALSPDGRLLAAAGKTNALVLIDPGSGRILQTVRLVAGVSNSITAEMSLAGLLFSPDGRRIYLSNAGGSVWVFPVDGQGRGGRPEVMPIPDAKAPRRRQEIPMGLALSGDGGRLYVAGNLGNRLHELDTRTGQVLRSWDTGVAPYDVGLAGGKAYVSNSGGRRPSPGAETVAPAGKGTTVRVDEVRHIPNEGSVTVIDLRSGEVRGEIMVELNPSALAVSPDGRHVVVANTGSDTLSVIDVRTDRVVEKIWARQTPADLFGAQPNALAFDPSGRRLYVCNGTQNAVAVIRFDPARNASGVAGLIPAGWFPGAVQYDPGRRALCVANIKGIGAAKAFGPKDSVKLNTKDFFGTVSLIPAPSRLRLAALTADARRNMHYPRMREALLPPRAGQRARPVPERAGEPSVFRHVIYVIKENRSYDQVLGDMPEGNGDAGLCIFGERYTPNQHKIAREFVLLDNTYCSGVQSADGHQWTDSAIASAYVERQLTSGSPRSYPGAKSEDNIDALAWASSGFLWDNALAHGKRFRNYGEWMMSEAGWADRARKGRVAWSDFWREHQTGGGRVRLRSRPGIESLRAHSNTNTVGWDLKVPDVMRAAEFIRELRQFEAGGGFPELTILFLPNDHTGGTRGEYPTPGAQIADNDLALGQVVEAVTRSRFWPETCLFAIEDDPQAGWDHVSGYRTTCFVVSPYTKRRQTISTPYNQTSLVRTIELILGLPPMNQLDASATPMADCFTETPDFTPFTCVPNRVPLDQLNPEPKAVADSVLRQDALVSSRLPLDEVDRCPEDVLNRILWRAMKGPAAPYPEWAVKAVDDD
ncbi:MAG TPA: bifunctional YncE family protein/alkaline phosphatase family protein [Candidatus Paceibacterota bacterium]|nr:bifunctional YncE family protein/alkaline phosphatase family protein [Verrucomicrobiota bacterium]HOX01577.1 bifunctional YncE family protein/alkaline phosphatase family protein [Verrucomicrobiota bacterium]HRZ44315.1 bifunctional YncE family protein/alkaline phosphatase family protein [Candidatus Paceibacterota bacterium]HRZ93901.1 bifunctional YncE family protein/alkaline phosphatase family protein [Candidatus Paceibacterota bacterium]